MRSIYKLREDSKSSSCLSPEDIFIFPATASLIYDTWEVIILYLTLAFLRFLKNKVFMIVILQVTGFRVICHILYSVLDVRETYVAVSFIRCVYGKFYHWAFPFVFPALFASLQIYFPTFLKALVTVPFCKTWMNGICRRFANTNMSNTLS